MILGDYHWASLSSWAGSVLLARCSRCLFITGLEAVCMMGRLMILTSPWVPFSSGLGVDFLGRCPLGSVFLAGLGV